MLRRTDGGIQHDVSAELRWDEQVATTSIDVSVDAGVVTLTGVVDGWGRRMAAQEAAHRVPGVLDVINLLRVKLPGSREGLDRQIERSLRHALERDELLGALEPVRIDVEVDGGVVTLSGSVESWRQHDRAVHAADTIAGVQAVVSRIEVGGPAPRASA